MNENNQEIEAKFYLAHPERLEERLMEMGAILKQERIFEANLRFDDVDGRLAKNHQVLRLRKDTRSRLTYKGPAQEETRFLSRPELEVEVSDFETTRLILEALGYDVYIAYEKYRTTYTYFELEITLDEMPYGFFAEIEGPDVPTIQVMAIKLGLNWKAHTPRSYLALFEDLCIRKQLEARNLTFAEFKGKTFAAADFNLQAADL